MTDSRDERPAKPAAPNRRTVLRRAVSRDEPASSRRGVLAGAVASVAAALGLTGTAAGFDPGRTTRLRRVEMRYRSEALAIDAFRERSRTVLDRLAAEGLLANGDVAELDAPEVNAIESGGVLTGHLAARTDLDEGELTVVVEPEAGRQYAILDRNDRAGATVFDPENLEAPQPTCDVGIGCAGGGCVCDAYEVVTCPGSDCYTNGPTGGTCNSCSACGSPACGW